MNYSLLKKGVLWIFVIFIDLAIYIFLGLVILNYEDFYDESEGPYFSLGSMTIGEKISYVLIHIWYVLHILLLFYLLYKTVQYFKLKSNS